MVSLTNLSIVVDNSERASLITVKIVLETRIASEKKQLSFSNLGLSFSNELNKNWLYNNWFMGQGHYLLCFFTSVGRSHFASFMTWNLVIVSDKKLLQK